MNRGVQGVLVVGVLALVGIGGWIAVNGVTVKHEIAPVESPSLADKALEALGD